MEKLTSKINTTYLGQEGTLLNNDTGRIKNLGDFVEVKLHNSGFTSLLFKFSKLSIGISFILDAAIITIVDKENITQEGFQGTASFDSKLFIGELSFEEIVQKIS